MQKDFASCCVHSEAIRAIRSHVGLEQLEGFIISACAIHSVIINFSVPTTLLSCIKRRKYKPIGKLSRYSFID